MFTPIVQGAIDKGRTQSDVLLTDLLLKVSFVTLYRS